MSQVVTVPPPASAVQALGMLRSAMGYLAAADATAMAAETQALCLQALEQASSIGTAARTSILAAFTSGQGYSADADYSPRALSAPAGAEDTRPQRSGATTPCRKPCSGWLPRICCPSGPGSR